MSYEIDTIAITVFAIMAPNEPASFLP